MKSLKNYMLMLCAVFAVACSDDDVTFNTGAATVEFGESTLTVKETDGLCTIPVVVSGEHTGTVKVTIGVEDNTAKIDEHYILTTQTLLIPAGEESVDFEFKPIDDDEINEDRTFSLVITEAVGATVGTNGKVAVTITDNDSNIYETLSGTWLFRGEGDGISEYGKEVVFSVKVRTAEEGTEAYNNYLVCSNTGSSFDPDGDIEWSFNWRLKYEYVPDTGKTLLSISLNDGDVATYGSYSIRFRRASTTGTSSNLYQGEYDRETGIITFERANLAGDLYSSGTMVTRKFILRNCTMEKLQ